MPHEHTFAFTQEILPGTKIRTLAERIYTGREARGIDQSELARRMKVSKATVSDWESGKIKNLRLGNIVRLSDVLELNIRWLAIGVGTPMKRLIETEEEYELILLLREMTPHSQKDLIAAARVMAARDKGAPTATQPFHPHHHK